MEEQNCERPKNIVKPKMWVHSVVLTRFDAKCRFESELFRTFSTCPHCQLLVKSQGLLNLHLTTCIKINPARFECDMCGHRWHRKCRLRAHMQSHSSERNFRCSKCSLSFKTNFALLVHSRLKSTHKCCSCDATFCCKLLLKHHRMVFHQSETFFCQKCPHQAKNKSQLKCHEATHDKAYLCESCARKFSRNQLLQNHQISHRHGIYVTASVESFDCRICKTSYTNKCYLRRHQRDNHDKEKELKCEICNKISKNAATFRYHKRSHVRVQCSICHEMTTKQGLRDHSRIHSGGFFECDLCGYLALQKINLKGHIERKHSCERGW